MSGSKTRPARPLPKEISEFALRDAPGYLLRRANERSEDLFTRAVGAGGPTRQQLALLVTVCQHPDASQQELVTLTGIDKNTLAQMIKRLTERGLLERKRTAHDARTNAISATDEALRLLNDVLPILRRVQEDILAPLPAELRPIFQRCLRIITGLDEPP